MVARTIDAHARQMPDRIAVVYNNNRLSYGRFAGLIEASRRNLAAQGLPGEGVAVLVIASVLDAWIQGIALRSLGLTTVIVRGPDEIARLGLPGIGCVVATEAERRPDIDAVCARAGWRLVRVPGAVHAGAAPAPAATPATPGGHILLTSGTTGTYKKVLIDPACQAEMACFRQAAFEISRRSVVHLFNLGGWTSVGYHTAVSTWDAGGRVVLYQGANKYESFRQGGMTHAFTVLPTLTELLAAPAGALRRDDRMRLYFMAGPLSQTMAQAAKTRLTPRLYTHLGSTEASAFTLTPIEAADDLRWHRIIDGRVVEVVDDGDRPVPAGVEGSVRVRTIGGVTGYLGDAEASRAFFRHGYFYTGDLGVMRADGRLALNGRVTDVVNVGGDKIAVGPVEAALQRQFEGSGICIFSQPDESGEEIVHVAMEAPRPVPQAAMVAALGQALPGRYRVQFHVVDVLPRDGLGKIQRHALKQRLRLPTTTA